MGDTRELRIPESPDVTNPVTLTTWPRLLTFELASSYLGLAEQTVRNRAAEIPGRRKLGRRTVFDRKVLDRAIDESNTGMDIWVAFQKAVG